MPKPTFQWLNRDGYGKWLSRAEVFRVWFRWSLKHIKLNKESQ